MRGGSVLRALQACSLRQTFCQNVRRLLRILYLIQNFIRNIRLPELHYAYPRQLQLKGKARLIMVGPRLRAWGRRQREGCPRLGIET
jgi:hypothetical protein